MSNTVENRLKFTTEGLAALTSSKKELEGLGKAGEAAGKQLDGLSSKSESLRKGMTSISTQLEGAKNALLGFAGVQGAGGVLALTDEFKTLNSRLLVTSDTAGQAANRYRELFAVAQQTRAPFSELVDLSSRFATATQGANISQERQINLVRTVSQAMTIGGGSTASMQAALVQLGQAMASGTLRGEELNSILEQAPRLAKALADGLGVSIGELRKLGATGQITSQDILRAGGQRRQGGQRVWQDGANGGAKRDQAAQRRDGQPGHAGPRPEQRRRGGQVPQ